MRKIWSALLAFVLLMAALPLSVFAQEPTPELLPAAETLPVETQQTPAAEEQEEKVVIEKPQKPAATLDKQKNVKQEAAWVYQMCRALAGQESFAGVCGKMTSYQLWVMGINDWLYSTDGNKQFDTYSAMEKTTGGHYIKAYSAQEYSLEEALNVITRDGTQDAYNILVGFEWTNTEAGALYGHACVINAILDGQVYFVESFYTSLGGPEGNVIVCSISEFANYFADWMVYEGLVYFGTKKYSDACDIYGTDVFVRTRFDTLLRSEPCLVQANGCVRLRSVSAGEMLRADAVCVNPQGEVYYRITDGDLVGYVAANAAYLLRENGEGLTATQLQIPTRVKAGKDFTISGTVTAATGKIGAIEVMVTDDLDRIILRERAEVDAYTCDLDVLNEDLLFDLLERGKYRVLVFADMACAVAGQTGVEVHYARSCVWEQPLQVGNALWNPAAKTELRTVEKPAAAHGWVWKDGTWYYYENGTPRTGWLEHTGVQYYLQEDGSVSTGWTEIDGVLRHFTANGALSAGWLTTQEGTMYCSSVGVALTGWQIIDDVRYYFDEKGFMKTEGSLQVGEKRYQIYPDGHAEEEKN